VPPALNTQKGFECYISEWTRPSWEALEFLTQVEAAGSRTLLMGVTHPVHGRPDHCA